MVAAAELFHARSFEDVSTAEVCALAGVHPGSLYHFFPTKQELGLARPGLRCGCGVTVRVRRTRDAMPGASGEASAG